MQDGWHGLSFVIAGLDPAIHLLFCKHALAKRMDPRVKPAGDAREWVGAEPMQTGTALVSRFRSSHHYAARSLANFGIKGTLAIYDSSAVFGFEVPTQTRSYNDRNFKSTALGVSAGHS
jgi:hypothetical protein